MGPFASLQHSFPACSLGRDQYGYACNREDTPGWQMSYTLSTSAVPPDNPCTRGLLRSAANNTLPAGANAWAHFLIAHAVTGYTRCVANQAQRQLRYSAAVSIQLLSLHTNSNRHTNSHC